jgi:hypothetical protein
MKGPVTVEGDLWKVRPKGVMQQSILEILDALETVFRLPSCPSGGVVIPAYNYHSNTGVVICAK